jgi:hypothetical protein
MTTSLKRVKNTLICLGHRYNDLSGVTSSCTDFFENYRMGKWQDQGEKQAGRQGDGLGVLVEKGQNMSGFYK